MLQNKTVDDFFKRNVLWNDELLSCWESRIHSGSPYINRINSAHSNRQLIIRNPEFILDMERLEKIIPMINEGIGLNDKYR